MPHTKHIICAPQRAQEIKIISFSRWSEPQLIRQKTVNSVISKIPPISLDDFILRDDNALAFGLATAV